MLMASTLMSRIVTLSVASVAAVLGISACEKQRATTDGTVVATAPATQASSSTQGLATGQFKLTASIAELMDAVIDPSADALWDSVGTTVDATGTTQHQPRTDEEWHEARRHAIALIEGVNLLVMDGRKLVAPGAAVLDQNVQGVLSPEEGQKKFDAQHAAFVQFAYALQDVGEQMLKAIDARDPAGMMAAGATMDDVCESCHLTFWYPNQVIPELPASLDANKPWRPTGRGPNR
jgi:hypothetical protein